MGNSMTKIDVPIQDTIGQYLMVQDAKALMQTCKLAHRYVFLNRPYWVTKARQLHALDPAVFPQLKDVEKYDQAQLVKLVCDGNKQCDEIRQQIFKGEWVTRMTVPIKDDGVQCITVDVKRSLLGIALKREIQIRSLNNLSDPPLCTISTEIKGYTQIVLHGNLLLSRPPKSKKYNHADVVNWAANFPLESLPGENYCHCRPLIKSDGRVATYNIRTNEIKIYSLGVDDYKKRPTIISYKGTHARTWVYDYQFRGPSILVLLHQLGGYYFEQRDIGQNRVLLRFLVASPTCYHEPKIAHPHVLLIQTPEAAHWDDETKYRVYGRNQFIEAPKPGDDDAVLPQFLGHFAASAMLRSNNDDALFLALVHPGSVRTNFFFIGGKQFRPCNYVDKVIPSGCFEPCGLSMIYSDGSNITHTRFQMA